MSDVGSRCVALGRWHEAATQRGLGVQVRHIVDGREHMFHWNAMKRHKNQVMLAVGVTTMRVTD